VSYLYNGDTYYWNGNTNLFSSFTVSDTNAWFNAGSSWQYTKNIVWPGDMSHLMTLQARGIDHATLADGTGGGNVSNPISISFKVDFVVPAGTITWPTANATLSSATIQMTGSESDDLAGVQITQVQISTGTDTSASYWTGSTWTAPGATTWLTTTTANPWYYTIPNPALVTGNLYYLRSQIIDAAGNSFATPITTFTYNTSTPTATITPRRHHLPLCHAEYRRVHGDADLAGYYRRLCFIHVLRRGRHSG
jgi:hypothetical protein